MLHALFGMLSAYPTEELVALVAHSIEYTSPSTTSLGGWGEPLARRQSYHEKAHIHWLESLVGQYKVYENLASGAPLRGMGPRGPRGPSWGPFQNKKKSR